MPSKYVSASVGARTYQPVRLLSESSTTRTPASRSRWTRFQNAVASVFRSFGLGLLVVLHQTLVRPWGRRFEESPKVAIRRNRTIALLRALVHIAPIGIALTEITLNWQGHYLGGNFLNISYYQFAAKGHELTIQASLGLIVFTYVRHHLVLENGLPFGALFSGFNVTQLGYLWSVEFWSAVTARSLTVWKRIGLMTIVVFTILLAAVAGPSSAILLIPTLDFWPAGNTFFWINATADAIWPSK